MRARWVFMTAWLSAVGAGVAQEEATVHWVWRPPEAVTTEATQTIVLRKAFALPEGKIDSTELKAAADDAARISIYGKALDDEVTVRRPKGDAVFTIMAVRYTSGDDTEPDA